MQELQDYRYASELLSKVGFYATAADLYGMVLGLLAGGIKRTDSEFKELLVNLVNDGEEIPAEVFTWINHQALYIAGQLMQGEGLRLLMPNDNSAACVRLMAITEIAHSFVTGFSCKQKLHSKLSHDVQEVLKDLMEFSQIDANVVDSNEVDKDLMILEEHISLSAQLCFEECAASLYPADNKDVFVLEEDNEAGKPVALSAERMAIHDQEEQFWEKQAKLKCSDKRYTNK